MSISKCILSTHTHTQMNIDSAPEYTNPVKELQDSTDMRQKFAGMFLMALKILLISFTFRLFLVLADT